MSRLALVAAALLLAAPARATFVRSLMDTPEPERLLDSEYFVDLRSFSWPRAWDDPWAASTGGYRLNGASLDCCSLLLDQGLVFTKRIGRSSEFRFRFEHQDDKDRQELHHWIELETALGRGFSAELFGEPTFRKEDADIGVGFRWRRGRAQARLRRNFVDWNFNARGSTAQRDSLRPRTTQAALDLPLGEGLVRFSGELDEPSRRDDPAAGRSFGYHRDRARLAWESDEGWAPRAWLSRDREERLDRYATPAQGTSTDFRRRVHELGASVRVRRERLEFEPGLVVMRRSAQADDPGSPNAGVSYLRWEAQPWLRVRRELTAVWLLEVSPFLSLGQRGVRRVSGSSNPTLAEAKLDTALEAKWSDSGRVGFDATWDLDTPGKPWDGGHVRVMFLF